MFIQLTPVNQVFADQYDVTILWDHVESSSRSPAFFKLTAVQVQVFDRITGPSQIKLLQPGALLLGLATSIYPVLADSQLPLKNIYQTYQIIRYSPIFCITKII